MATNFFLRGPCRYWRCCTVPASHCRPKRARLVSSSPKLHSSTIQITLPTCQPACFCRVGTETTLRWCRALIFPFDISDSQKYRVARGRIIIFPCILAFLRGLTSWNYELLTTTRKLTPPRFSPQSSSCKRSLSLFSFFPFFLFQEKRKKKRS